MFENNSLQVELNKQKEDNNILNEHVSDLKSKLNEIEDNYESKMSTEHNKNTKLIKTYKSSHNQTIDQLQKRYEIEIKDKDAK